MVSQTELWQNLRVHIFQFLEEALVLAAHKLLVPEDKLPRREQLCVLFTECLILRHVVPHQFRQLLALHLS